MERAKAGDWWWSQFRSLLNTAGTKRGEQGCLEFFTGLAEEQRLKLIGNNTGASGNGVDSKPAGLSQMRTP